MTGALFVAGAAGLRQSSTKPNAGTLAAITAASTGILLASLFTTDPVNGYPPGTPMVADRRTKAGVIHDAVAIPTFFGLPIAAASHSMACARRGDKTWAVYGVAASTAMIASLAAATAGFNGSERWVASAGAWQRICVASGLLWLSAVMGRALHRS